MPPGVGYPPAMPMMGAGPMGGGAMPPMGSTAPAAARPDNEGMRVRGSVLVNLAMKPLAMAVTLLGPSTEEGMAVLEALKRLGKSFPAPVSDDLSQQEVKLLGARANPAPMGDTAARARAMLANLNPGGAAAPAPMGAGPV